MSQKLHNPYFPMKKNPVKSRISFLSKGTARLTLTGWSVIRTISFSLIKVFTGLPTNSKRLKTCIVVRSWNNCHSVHKLHKMKIFHENQTYDTISLCLFSKQITQGFLVPFFVCFPALSAHIEHFLFY